MSNQKSNVSNDQKNAIFKLLENVRDSGSLNSDFKFQASQLVSQINKKAHKLVNNNKSNTLPTNFHFSDWFTGFINSIAKLFKGS